MCDEEIGEALQCEKCNGTNIVDFERTWAIKEEYTDSFTCSDCKHVTYIDKTL
ncbi:hypothetical protein [Wohlfahrtiimonas sp. G9077]|uniref:hypothetical protein n=1 Tax=Wohlfahrtiimonas sp. G9077 TaxID=1980118 RepID=UPI00131451E4|nr:hypothetical protein [Wohlfahrtiimonas sp. G9077]